ncbi:shufflon system plasmid conjugative transfer pilus tip adhesin PilV [Citrobacter freundii]|uniref:shufflon system plasmid conjugative transfer pilus tip adhesin PilV n=1 Tax=Citrobacter freundii TaxID=546 RepID=UPI001C8CA107|nr:shufflon system plasmid conjugative transfer pilus tip adhesin PilV [Citrobacter freundii]MBX8903033.1 shufflon system plasmid conjugative transfer pilus tip adhesin PilV [Citrobacter freundii]MEB0319123.1 shufflon system plasmid conjugative transfer pilus tip adhesin PilV [Citrobacter freundii]MEB0341720.1 shufflon system plasmid conjugative transfer pilus tip adhesin PilV [Citrobacter freundii]MEB0373334.1 shufflon system plasmid conjugative transfer pilus tip adhesin PilV [Citrobacter fre
MQKKNKDGFSLLELILALGVGSVMAFMKFQDMKSEQETLIANAVGTQIKQIGNAVNSYISLRYDKISTLSSTSNQSSDPGPRTCSANGCEITYQTLINEGLLPSTYSGINMQKSSYKILLKRSGTSPNYVINGLLTTTVPWIEGNKMRYDLLGKAMQVAGIDSGMTQSATSASGYNGLWSEMSSDFPSINSSGLLVYRVGYDSSMYSVYLRRDGTLPMTGDLNMGGKSINNTLNINASGLISANSFKTTGTVSVGSDLSVSGNTQVNGNLNSNNTVSGNTVTSRGETNTQNWFRTLGDGGIYFQKYGGGWYMADTATITAYGGKNISTQAGVYGGSIHSSGNIEAVGKISGGNVVSNGRTTTGEFLQINGQAQTGGGCSPNGLQGRTSEGAILSCVNGVWTGAVVNGRYISAGTHNGSYSGSNNTGKSFKLYVFGGNPPPSKISSGNADNCVNTYALTGIVNGVMVANAVSGNSEWNKSGSIVFDVPAGASWSIVSNGMRGYGCGPGNFSVVSYQ